MFSTSDTSACPSILEAAFAAGGLQLAAPIDYSENMRVLVDELRAITAKDGEQT
jgi:hypothetical protein